MLINNICLDFINIGILRLLFINSIMYMDLWI